MYARNYPEGMSATMKERQEAIEEFLDYALSKKEVRVVPVKSILEWVRNPEGAEGLGSFAGKDNVAPSSQPPMGNDASSATYTKRCSGIRIRASRSTERPPIPESKTRMVMAFFRPRAARLASYWRA